MLLVTVLLWYSVFDAIDRFDVQEDYGLLPPKSPPRFVFDYEAARGNLELSHLRYLGITWKCRKGDESYEET